MSAEQEIQDGQRVTQFLTDPAVQAALQRLKEKYQGEWMAGQTPSDRENAWAKARALDDFAIELSATQGRGERANANLKREQRTVPHRAR